MRAAGGICVLLQCTVKVPCRETILLVQHLTDLFNGNDHQFCCLCALVTGCLSCFVLCEGLVSQWCHRGGDDSTVVC